MVGYPTYTTSFFMAYSPSGNPVGWTFLVLFLWTREKRNKKRQAIANQQLYEGSAEISKDDRFVAELDAEGESHKASEEDIKD